MISASQSLSQKVVDSFCQATGAKNRGVMTTDTMSGINWSTIPVTIIEMGFMTNQAEDLNMADSSYQSKMVQGIANG
ncbi:N-acetylmuramoyl-L-alanine amidase, partial [Klebsiella pneumoniae]|uniref:N-acetylmuramoyl-L-alanine amidase n=1 Tax=Klebsiella pneumoniae TaxID=573 RepID=UPI003AF5E586